MEKIVITGGSGFLGANLIHKLNKTNSQIHVILRPNTNEWRILKIKNKIKIHYVDIINEKRILEILKNINPTIIFHCATYGVNPSQTNFKKILETNIIGSTNIFSASRNIDNIKKIINIGSSFEYDSQKQPVKENDSVSPTTIYGISKAAQTNLAQYYSKNFGLPIVTLRIFTPYGRYDSQGRLFSDLMISAIKNKKLSVGMKSSVRDFIHIDDVLDALLLFAKNNKINGIFNIGTGKKMSVEQIIELCERKLKMNYKISWGSNKNIRKIDTISEAVIANMKKTKNTTNWKPKIKIDEGIQKSYLWYRKNIELYE